ncbi:hypothetical protein AALA79_21500 [Lachnospiraceae bacterium 64-25]
MCEELYGVIGVLRYRHAQKRFEKRKVKKYVQLGMDKIPVHRERILDGCCSILLPETFVDMELTSDMVGYRSLWTPQSIKTTAAEDAVLSFGLIPMAESGTEEMPVSDKLEKLRQDMKRKWTQDVYYGTGQVQADGRKAAWMDLKSFSARGSMYSFIFLFEIKGETVFGNFYCSFEQYLIWKPVMQKLIATIEFQG